MQQFNLLKFL